MHAQTRTVARPWMPGAGCWMHYILVHTQGLPMNTTVTTAMAAARDNTLCFACSPSQPKHSPTPYSTLLGESCALPSPRRRWPGGGTHHHHVLLQHEHGRPRLARLQTHGFTIGSRPSPCTQVAFSASLSLSLFLHRHLPSYTHPGPAARFRHALVLPA